MVNNVIAELLLIALMVAAAAALAITIAPPAAKPVYEIKVKDAYPPATSQELFDVIMISGEIQYSNLKVSLINATTGGIVDVATYNGDLSGSVITAEITDTDSYFNTGDFLRFKGSVAPGMYEVIVSGDRYIAFDGLVAIK